MLRRHRCMPNLLPRLSSVRAGIVTGTTTGTVIGSVGSGKSAIGADGNGMTRETIAAGLEVIGATTMTAVVREATGTATTKMTAVGATTNASARLVSFCVPILSASLAHTAYVIRELYPAAMSGVEASNAAKHGGHDRRLSSVPQKPPGRMPTRHCFARSPRVYVLRSRSPDDRAPATLIECAAHCCGFAQQRDAALRCALSRGRPCRVLTRANLT
jgi:hypothetical protein